jgi:hypothetical protein
MYVFFCNRFPQVTLNYFTNAKSARFKRRIVFQMNGWQGAAADAGAEDDEELA